MDTRPLTEEYTQDDWNTDLNNRLLNVARNTKVEMKKFNEWATNSAIQGLNNMDPRWDEYAESQQLYNTADFKTVLNLQLYKMLAMVTRRMLLRCCLMLK